MKKIHALRHDEKSNSSAAEEGLHPSSGSSALLRAGIAKNVSAWR